MGTAEHHLSAFDRLVTAATAAGLPDARSPAEALPPLCTDLFTAKSDLPAFCPASPTSPGGTTVTGKQEEPAAPHSRGGEQPDEPRNEAPRAEFERSFERVLRKVLTTPVDLPGGPPAGARPPGGHAHAREGEAGAAGAASSASSNLWAAAGGEASEAEANERAFWALHSSLTAALDDPDEHPGLFQRLVNRHELHLVLMTAEEMSRLTHGQMATWSTGGLAAHELRALLHAVTGPTAPTGEPARRFMALLQAEVGRLPPDDVDVAPA
jgi:hypothetical protein